MTRTSIAAILALFAPPITGRAQADGGTAPESATVDVVHEQERATRIWIEGEPRDVVDAYGRIEIVVVPGEVTRWSIGPED